MKRKLLFVPLMLLPLWGFVSPGRAQTRASNGTPDLPTAADIQPLHLEHSTYTAKDGAEAVRLAVADAQGYTWFSLVDRGITHFCRFDGRRFTAVDTIGPCLGALATANWETPHTKDAEGKVWMGGDNGVVRLWNGEVEKHFTAKNGLASDTVLVVRTDEHGGVWVMTAKGICCIHRENGEDRISVAVDSSMLNVSEAVTETIRKSYRTRLAWAGMAIDSEDGVWWWVGQSPDTTTTVHRLVRTPQGISEMRSVKLPFKLTNAWSVGAGLLIRNGKGRFMYYPAHEKERTLDKRLRGYWGADSKGRLYFTTRAKDGMRKIIRDQPDSTGRFGQENSPGWFEFPMVLSTKYSLCKVRDEIWISHWGGDQPVWIIRGDSILPAKDLYPFDLTGGRFISTDEESVWMLMWGKREVTELHFSEGVEYRVCDLNPNGLWPLQYNRKTETYFFSVQKMRSGGDVLASYQDREWQELPGTKGTRSAFQTDILGNIWYGTAIRDSMRLIHIGATGDLDSMKFEIPSGKEDRFRYSPDDRGSWYILTSDSTLTLYREKELRTYPLTGIKDILNIEAFADGSVYMHAKDGLYRWTPENLQKIMESDGLPADSLAYIAKSFSKLFIRTEAQIGWIEDGKVSLVDTLRYPQLKHVAYALQDRVGRVFLYGNRKGEPVRELWMLEGETLRRLPLPGSFSFPFPTLILGEEEIILPEPSNSRIYRYSREHDQFYVLENVGDYFGYIWGGYIDGGDLIISGWGRHFLKVDLKRVQPTFPALSLQSIQIDKEETRGRGPYTLAFGSVLDARYIAIEKLDQTYVFYQTRLAGLDSTWSEPTKNESIAFRNLPAASYRFEVRARGECELWGKPIGFDFTVLPPWYATVWAFSGYAMAFAGLLLRVVRVTQRRLTRKHAAELARIREESERKLLEAENRQIKAATERKSRFLASMSHEIRTPMNAIIGFTRIVLRRGANQLSERHRDNLEKVFESAIFLLNLINDILDLSKIEAGRMEAKPAHFNVEKLIDTCCATITPLVKPGVQLRQEVSEDVGEAYTDEARVRQIVINLLSNARKFTEKGEIAVRVSKDREDDGREFLKIAVSDTGIGIREEMQERIFDEFQQEEGANEEQKGTGLGLAITRGWTELLGGVISVESEVDRGSAFRVRIPMVYRES